MTDMGRHNLLNGHRGEDGAAAVPVIAPLAFPRLGPLSPWPQPRAELNSPAAAVPERQRYAIDGDTAIRLLAGAVVLAVAAFAAIVSYSHIFELGRLHGQDGTAARLLPLSVDGLIAAASLVMLHAARNKLPVPGLARWMLGLGVGATVAANVEYGLPFGWLAAVVSAWPAVAFVGSVEMAVRFVRDARHAATADQPLVAEDGDTEDDTDGDTDDDSDPPLPPPPNDEKPNSRRRTPPPSGRAKAVAILKAHPDWTDAVVAKKSGVSERTVQRARRELAKASS